MTAFLHSAFCPLHFTAYGKEKAVDAVLPGRAEVPVALKRSDKCLKS